MFTNSNATMPAGKKEVTESIIPILEWNQLLRPTTPAAAAHNFEIDRLEHLTSKLEHLDKPHRHNFYLLLYVTEGFGYHDIDFQQYELKQGQLYFLYPGQVHSWKHIDQLKGFVCTFTPEFFSLRYNTNNLFEFPFLNYNQSIPFISVSSNDQDQFNYLFQQMERECVEQKQDASKTLKSYLNIVLVEINRRYKPLRENRADKHGQTIVQRFEILINQHFRDMKGVRDFAGMLHITPNYLNAICTKVTGRSAGEHIRDRVVLEAKRLLLHSDHTVSEIASQLNFDDNSYFCRFFKKYTNVTPEQFRKSNLTVQY